MKLKINWIKQENDINKKTKYIDEFKGIREKFDHQNDKIKELESELNEKNKNINTLENNIKDLENKNIEITIKSNESYDNLNKTRNEEIKKLKKK